MEDFTARSILYEPARTSIEPGIHGKPRALRDCQRWTRRRERLVMRFSVIVMHFPHIIVSAASRVLTESPTRKCLSQT